MFLRAAVSLWFKFFFLTEGIVILMRQYYNQVNERELIQLLRERNEPAFRLLVEQYRNTVFSTVFNILRDKEDAEDSTQEVFIQVFESISSFKQQSSLSTWTYRIAVRKAIDKLRRRKTRQKLQQWLPWWMPQEKKSEESFQQSGSLESKEKLVFLYKAMDALPERQRLALTLIKIQGMSYDETAEIMQAGVKAIESLVSRGKENLEKKLKQLK